MPSSVSRGPITERVLAELQTEGFPVGDNSNPPPPYGWSGEPGATGTTFTPWMTCTPLAGSPQRLPGAMGDTGTEWSLPYTVFYAGITRKQTEALADRLREALTNIAREAIITPTGKWRIQKISCTAIGSSNKVGSAYPDYYTQADTFDVWVSRGQ
jgi:hypothetical protein